MSRKRLFLIDGSALFYRSHFAFIRNPLINSKGVNTSAVYGYTNYLLKIFNEEKPDYLAVVFDHKSPTFRHKMYDQYKATREKMPDEMREQYPHIIQMTEAFDVPLLEMAGYEADDIIGTLAKRGEAQGFEVFMATSDKDMMQLLSPNIHMYSMRPGKDSEIMDENYLMEKYGLKPLQVIDYLALMGDTSDNIPGVPKVGDKTARLLLQEFGNIDNLYENIENVTKKAVKASLIENRDKADLSRELTTIEVNVPIEIDWESIKLSKIIPNKIIPLFDELEFKTLRNRLYESAAELPEDVLPETNFEKIEQHYHLINTAAKLNEFVEKLSKNTFFVFDTETTGLDPFDSKVIGIAFSWKAKEAYYVAFNHPESQLTEKDVFEKLKPILENENVKKGAQNIKFDALMLLNHGIKMRGLTFDTMIANFLITSNSRENGLDAMAEKYLGYKMISIETLIGKKGKNQLNMSDVSLKDASPYACEDADITFQLCEVLKQKLEEAELLELFETVEMPLVEVLLDVENNGVTLDTTFLSQMSEELLNETEVLKKKVFEVAGEAFNLNSTQQLGVILFEKLEIHKELNKRAPKKTKSGKFSTAESELLKFEKHPVVNTILEYRKMTKLKSTYVDALPALIKEKTGRVHTSFNQTVAATGRLSSSDPNLQNIPIRGQRGREIRKAFVPASANDVILSADYSQIELRVIAHICGDEAMLAAFQNNEDIHKTTASAVFGVEAQDVTPDMRRKAKEVNFGIIYGISRFGLANRLDISNDEAEMIISNYFARFPKVNEYMRDTILFVSENRYVKTMLGRRRYIPEIHSKNGQQRQIAERVAINSRIQGSAADLIKIAMINIYKRLQKENSAAKMILQVHDELVFEVPKSEAEALKKLVLEEMENAMQLTVPLKAEAGIGDNWLEAH